MCHNEKRPEYKFPVYQHIRENGGWDNWNVVPIEQYPCDNKEALKIREQHWIDTLGSTLNAKGATQQDTSVADAARKKAWTERNRERVRENQRRYYLEHREQRIAYQRERRGCCKTENNHN